jgi:mRNA interferase MazF
VARRLKELQGQQTTVLVWPGEERQNKSVPFYVSRNKGIRSHVAVMPPEGGVREASYVKCEDVRSISIERLVSRWGAVAPDTLHGIEDRLRILMGL